MKYHFLFAICGATGVAWAATARAATFFSDDFESPITPATYWVNTVDDADPTTPVIGPTWIAFEHEALNQYLMQEVNHPTDITPSTWAPGNAGPTFSASPTGGNQYLHMWGYPTIYEWAAAPIPGPEQDNIEASGHLRLNVDTYALAGVDGWHGGLRITGWDSPVVVGSPPTGARAFDVLLVEDGSVLYSTLNDVNGIYGIPGSAPLYNSGFIKVPGLTHDINTWEELAIWVNFNTDTFSLSLDGVSANGLTWAGGDLSKIQYVTLAMAYISSPRGGYDNFTLYEPEPGSAGVLAIAGAVTLLRRRARARDRRA